MPTPRCAAGTVDRVDGGSPAAASPSAGSPPAAEPAATFGAGRRRQGGPRRLRAAGRPRVEARRANPHPTPPRRHPHAPPSRRATQEDTRGGARLCIRRRRPGRRRTATAHRHQLPRRRPRRRRPQPALCLRRAPGHAHRLPTLPVAAPPHPRRPHWRPPSRCTPPRCLPQAQCPPDPRTPSLPHTFTTLPPPTHRPTPPRRRLTAPIPPDSATGPALALPRLRRPSTTAVFPRASSPRSTMGAPHHGCTPTDSLPRPPRRPPSLPVGTRRSITTVPAHTHPSCVPPVCAASLF